MRRRRMVVWMAAAALVALGQSTWASHETDLDQAGLKAQATENRALGRYLRHNGYPDVAQVRPIVDQPPWDDHEVTLYYLDAHKEISFARARILGKPEIHTTRYERTLTDADVRALRAHVGSLASAPAKTKSTPAECTGNAVARAECSAARAENAADRVDVAAVRAEKAADKTEAIVAKMAASPPRRRRHKSH